MTIGSPRAARCAGGADAVDRRHAGGGVVRAGGRGEDFDGRERRGADAGAIELLERGLRVAGAAERPCFRAAEQHALRDDAERDEHGRAAERGGDAVADDQARPGGPVPLGAVGASQPAGVGDRPDRREHDGQQRQRDGDGHERDEQAAVAHRAQERHRQHERREQSDRHGGAAEQHGAPGGSGGVHDRLLVASPALSFLTPAHDDQERVVDRDAEADQRDEEDDDQVDLGQRGEPPDGQQRDRDRDDRHQQRYEGECGREDEHQHDQCPDAGDERLVQEAGTAALAWRLAGQQRGTREPYLGAAHARAGGGLLGARQRRVADLVPARPAVVDRGRRRMHDRERGAAVV